MFQSGGGFVGLMGCINGKSVLTEEDIDFIAKNTAMDRSKVEVRQGI